MVDIESFKVDSYGIIFRYSSRLLDGLPLEKNTRQFMAEQNFITKFTFFGDYYCGFLQDITAINLHGSPYFHIGKFVSSDLYINSDGQVYSGDKPLNPNELGFYNSSLEKFMMFIATYNELMVIPNDLTYEEKVEAMHQVIARWLEIDRPALETHTFWTAVCEEATENLDEDYFSSLPLHQMQA